LIKRKAAVPKIRKQLQFLEKQSIKKQSILYIPDPG